MTKKITLPDGTTCYSAPNCRKHFPSTTPEVNPQNNPKDYVRMSKTLSYLLRHKPETAGITLEKEGWVNIHQLVNQINNHKLLKTPITENDVAYIVANDSKKRYSVENGRIRAAQGHSTKVDLNLKPMTPPQYLYHGTSVDTVNIILKEGLKPMSRQHVHLSANVDTAINVGTRHGKPKILIINAEKAHNDGIKFFKADNGVWLVETLPVEYINPDV